MVGAQHSSHPRGKLFSHQERALVQGYTGSRSWFSSWEKALVQGYTESRLHWKQVPLNMGMAYIHSHNWNYIYIDIPGTSCNCFIFSKAAAMGESVTFCREDKITSTIVEFTTISIVTFILPITWNRSSFSHLLLTFLTSYTINHDHPRSYNMFKSGHSYLRRVCLDLTWS